MFSHLPLSVLSAKRNLTLPATIFWWIAYCYYLIFLMMLYGIKITDDEQHDEEYRPSKEEEV
jgi:hypothetical protein